MADVELAPTAKEHPILFSGPLVRAILDGRKTQTRRLYKPKVPYPYETVEDGKALISDEYGDWHERVCPYGKPGDRLYVREAFYCDDYRYPDGPRDELLRLMEYRASHDCAWWEAGCPCRDENGRSSWRPSIHMPRWASRIDLAVTGVRVERLQDISEEDAIAEGVSPAIDQDTWKVLRRDGSCYDCFVEPDANDPEVHSFVKNQPLPPEPARDVFARLWDSINGKRDGASWASNPWVWVVSFERLEASNG